MKRHNAGMYTARDTVLFLKAHCSLARLEGVLHDADHSVVTPSLIYIDPVLDRMVALSDQHSFRAKTNV